MRRVLIIHKSGRVHTWCEDLRLGFAELGHEARAVALRDRSVEERRIEARKGLRLLHNPATVDRLVREVQAHKPSLILFLNMTGLPAIAHEKLRRAAKGAPMAAWLADHVQRIAEGCLPNLDAIYAFDSATLPVLREGYQGTGARIDFLPLAVNPSRFPDSGLAWSQRQQAIAFVGNHTQERLTLIRDLKALGASVACFGPGAESGWRMWRRRRIPPATAAAIYGRHRFALNMLQHPNTIHGVNLRAYEIAASGGLGTYPETPDLGHAFEPGEEVIAYRDPQDLLGKMEELDRRKACRIVERSRARTLSEHTYMRRAQHFLHHAI